MTGDMLKSRVEKLDDSMAEIARKLGTTRQQLHQAFGAADIKTGFIEQLSAIYGKPVGFFFGEEEKVTVTGNERSFNSNADDVLKTLTDTISSQQHTIDSLSARIAHLTDRLLDSPK